MEEGHGGVGERVAGRGWKGERMEGSDVILFQLKTYFLKKEEISAVSFMERSEKNHKPMLG